MPKGSEPPLGGYYSTPSLMPIYKSTSESTKFRMLVYSHLRPFNVFDFSFTGDDAEKENQYAEFTLHFKWPTRCHLSFDGLLLLPIQQLKAAKTESFGDETIDLARRMVATENRMG